MDQFFLIAFKALAMLFSIVLHEVAHGAVAYSLGDQTAKRLGRLTLNPFKHIDLFGSIILPLLTFFGTGLVFGYAKPVPYNPYNLRDQKYGPAKVGAAGPITNFTLAVLFGAVLRFLPGRLGDTLLPDLLKFIVYINLLLGVFNLMPVPPLDGHWLAVTFFPSLANFFKRSGLLLFFVLILFIFPLLSPIILWLFRLITGTI